MIKQCRTCKDFKEEEEFYFRGKRKGKQRNGRDTECIVCARLRTKNNSTPKSKRYHMVHFKFGLKKEQYDELVQRFPVCACCGNDFKKNEPHVDHCHNSNKIRGLLCGNCNVGLGMFKDNPELLEKAKQYLIKSLAADCPIAKGRATGYSSN